jgi:hypothetical protein
MQHKERRETNEMAIQILHLAVFDVLRSTQTFSCLGWPLLTITVSACLPARQGPSRRTLRGAQHILRHSRTWQSAIQLFEICLVSVCDDPGQPLAVGTPAPRVDPRRSAYEIHVLCLGLQQSIDAKIARGERAGTPKLGNFIPKFRK